MKPQIQIQSKKMKSRRKALLVGGALIALGSVLAFPGSSQADTVINVRKLSKASAIFKVPAALNSENNSLANHKINDGKGGITNQQPIAGFPSQAGQPSNDSSLPGGIAVATDPSARPDLANFKKKLPGDLSDESDDLSKGEDGLSKLRKAVEQYLNALGASLGAADQNLQPGNTPYGSEESMVGADTDQKKGRGATGTTIAPSTYDSEGLHSADGGKTSKDFAGTTLGDVGTAIGKGLPNTPTGQALKQATDESDNQSKPGADSSGSNSGSNSGNNSGSGGSGTDTKKDDPKVETSSDGNVTKFTYADGTVAVRDEKNGTTTTMYPDGSTKTTKNGTGEVIDETHPSTSIPNSDNEGAPLPADIQKQLDADKAALRAIGPKHEPGYIDFGGEGSDAGMPVGTTEKKGDVPDKKGGLITNPGTSDATSPAHPSLDQNQLPKGPDPDVIHVE